MKRGLAIAITTALLAIPVAAEAQEASGPAVTVNQIVIPATRGKLVNKGVAVNASCSPGCLLVVKLILPDGVASKLGLGKPVVGRAVAGGEDGVATWLRAPITAKARDPLRHFKGTPNMSIRVTALP